MVLVMIVFLFQRVFDKTLAQLSVDEKNNISHRFKALELAKIILKILNKG